MDSPYQHELKTAIAAVQRAAHLSKAVLAAAGNRVSHVDKQDHSPVTVADFAVQALLTAALTAAFPGDAFVGEETADDLRADSGLLDRVWTVLKEIAADTDLAGADGAPQIPDTPDRVCALVDRAGLGVPGTGRVWVFDPIDGTQTFLRGEIYAINACLLVDGEQTVAVVGLPNLHPDAVYPVSDKSVDPDPKGGSILYGVRGHGAFRRPLTGPADLVGDRLPRHEDTPANLRFVTSTVAGSSALGVNEKVAAKLGMEYPGNDLLGWVPRWATLAMGYANVTVWAYARRERQGKIWDHAGAMLLFEEVGGKVSDVDGKVPDLKVGRKMVSNYGWVAAPPGVHGRVLETVREVLREEGMGHLLR
ncbi:hypothetical protein ACRALDRAFT_2041806 [Sodiomyces alcalophilus JCM 7366]|uniref:uncharacterized protein n=1 Tax=Sodiomyces alcalophilus JCM 7366 TaxID=591952 RepID=UPI0039B3F1CB